MHRETSRAPGHHGHCPEAVHRATLRRMTFPRSAQLLSGVLATAGVLHFAKPAPFDSIVPKRLPGSARTWTYPVSYTHLTLPTNREV